MKKTNFILASSRLSNFFMYNNLTSSSLSNFFIYRQTTLTFTFILISLNLGTWRQGQEKENDGGETQ